MIMDEYARDEFATRILNGKVRNKRYVIKKGLIMRRNRILLVSNSMVR